MTFPQSTNLPQQPQLPPGEGTPPAAPVPPARAPTHPDEIQPSYPAITEGVPAAPQPNTNRLD
ncbi:hypothetical protein SAMN05428957_103267 [Oryzisolibacter propanilivorax]|uniref:Uncharacterized protein n=1 Tax=Oryzisolibacter propanilivorax TaxID=1527607 RepID=A0A1G9RJ17_9BURK|nr:hypothetical protein [Oryzisolibacter propanilivorax]SDM22435.1 hypothetical protein SAMN05428957_103267 [Oryzisolibacter propanilivorax]